MHVVKFLWAHIIYTALGEDETSSTIKFGEEGTVLTTPKLHYIEDSTIKSSMSI